MVSLCPWPKKKIKIIPLIFLSKDDLLINYIPHNFITITVHFAIKIAVNWVIVCSKNVYYVYKVPIYYGITDINSKWKQFTQITKKSIQFIQTLFYNIKVY